MRVQKGKKRGAIDGRRLEGEKVTGYWVGGGVMEEDAGVREKGLMKEASCWRGRLQ